MVIIFYVEGSLTFTNGYICIRISIKVANVENIVIEIISKV